MMNGNSTGVFDNFQAMEGEEIVISGLSGVFPNSNSVLEFGENLYNEVDMVSDAPRWSTNDPEVPKHVGKISEIDKFDAQFFRVGYQQGKVLEPISRKILEHAYAAIFDSGNTQATLKGIKIGVFIGVSFADFSTLCMNNIEYKSNFIVGGSSKSMLANRISYWVDGRGPSYCLDFSCASSAAALEKAYLSMRNGECDAAVVGSGNICSHPMLSLNLKKAGFLCLDGKTKCFDKHADGYVRAEAVSLLFMQKAKHAKRVYAEVYYAKGKYELKSDAHILPVRKSEDIQRFLTEFYSETDIGPEDVEYVEANGAATVEVDKHEIDAIAKVFAHNKTVKIGCVKSNMGHSEAVSGLAAVTKLCLAYHKGELPANLHYTDPLDVAAVQDGKIQVLTKPTKFNRGFTALNNFSFTGANFHVLLKGHYKDKILDKYKSQIPRIVLASAREESGVNKIFNALKSKAIDAEEIALYHSIFEKDVIGHTGRGFSILDTKNQSETVSLMESVGYYSGVRPPLWFVFSGMGSQWTAMGADLMKIPTFNRAIHRCQKVLESRGVDVIKIISEPDNTIFDNILNAFVGIGAVQVGLIDLLKEMGVEPDYIIGHSLGEMACAYHDNTFTTEEMILATYCRGKAIVELPLVKGSMAAIGLGYKDLFNCCPPEIDIGCHNSSESSTISGPADVVKDFVAELSKRGVFARQVHSAGVAYHSRYVADAGPALLHSLRETIKHPKLRSKKWLSTSVPKEHWDTENARYSSPEYHKNNLLSPVLFEETISMIPSNAVVVEIAPHGLLQAILKRSHPDCVHIPLTRRGCPDSVKFLLEGIGKLYQAGYNPKVDILYPRVEFPVSTETAFLSHMVEWEHSESWPIFEKLTDENKKTLSRDVIVSLHDDDYSYIADNVVNGVSKIPEAALLVYVWETVALNKHLEYRNLSIIFKDIHFHSDVFIQPDNNVTLTIMVSQGNDQFEISQDGTLVASGIACGVKTLDLQPTVGVSNDDFDDVWFDSKDVYQILKMQGLNYNGVLKSMHSVNVIKNYAYVKQVNNWIPFLDSLIQYNIVVEQYTGTPKPKFIRNLKINVLVQEKTTSSIVDGTDCYVAYIDKTIGQTRCAGVEINDITFSDDIPCVKEPNIIREKQFFPFFALEKVNINTALDVVVQIIAENSYSKEIKIIKCFAAKEPELFKKLPEIESLIPEISLKIESIIFGKMKKVKLDEKVSNVLVYENLFKDLKVITDIKNSASKYDFVLTLENQIPRNSKEINKHFNILACMSDGKQILMLLKMRNDNKSVSYLSLQMDNKFSWISRAYDGLLTTKKVILVSENQVHSGIIGLVTKLKREKQHQISLLAIYDMCAPRYNDKNEFYKDQLEKHMSVNILKKGQWGGLYYTSREKSVRLHNFTLLTNISRHFKDLSWAEAPPRSSKKLLVQVSYSGLSLNDCNKTTSEFDNGKQSLGMDFSGIDKNGDRVMGILPEGCMSSAVEADSSFLWPVPDHWSLEDAATVPLPYALAYYCLVLKSELKTGQRVLVTGGAGTLGQALISICLSLNCTVFTTVSEIRKKNFLLRLFPQLNDKNISTSEPISVCSMIMVNTQEQGCHLVINTGTGAFRKACMKCVGFMGYFLDLSNHDMCQNKNIGMSYLTFSKSYRAVDISNIFKPEYNKDKELLQHYISEGIARGVVTPLTRVVYPPAAVSRAFRLLAARKNRGRVLLKLRDPEIMREGLTVSPRLTFNPQDVVVVVCDENGFGAALTDKLIDRGARHLVLHINPTAISGYVHTKFISWSKREVSVKLSSENLRSEQGCAILMKNAKKFGNVKAVFVVLDGKEDDNEEKEDFINAYRKCEMVSNLDLVTRACTDVSHFAIVASLNLSASEEYAHTVLEQVCELRNEMGFPALVIRYSTINELNASQNTSKLEPQSIATFFNSMEISLKMKYKNVLTFNLKSDHSDFCKKIAAILGVRNIEDMKNETNLLDLNLGEIPLNELRAAIKSSYRIDYPLEKISALTIQSLKELCNIENTQTVDFECGLGVFYKKIDSEEDYLLQEPVMFMPTNCANGIGENDQVLIMIPGFDGRCEDLKTAAETLKINAVGVQLGPDLEGNSIREIAQYVKKSLETKIKTESTFHILGYSFGVNVALELAAIFEDEGRVGTVYCLDSSPEALRSYFNAYTNELHEDLENEILMHMYGLMAGNKNKKLKEELDKSNNYEEKVTVTLKALKKLISYSEQYKRHVLESAYKRINLAREYKPSIKLESELILLKGLAHPSSENLAEDYYLSQYTKKPIKIFELKSDHGFAHQDLRVSNIINRVILQKM